MDAAAKCGVRGSVELEIVADMCVEVPLVRGHIRVDMNCSLLFGDFWDLIFGC